MDISDRRVVQFREWAERQFGIGSGPYPDAEDLLSVVMNAVDARERAWQDSATEVLQPQMDPEFLRYVKRAMGEESD